LIARRASEAEATAEQLERGDDRSREDYQRDEHLEEREAFVTGPARRRAHHSASSGSRGGNRHAPGDSVDLDDEPAPPRTFHRPLRSADEAARREGEAAPAGDRGQPEPFR